MRYSRYICGVLAALSLLACDEISPHGEAVEAVDEVTEPPFVNAWTFQGDGVLAYDPGCPPGALGCVCDHRRTCLPHAVPTVAVVCRDGFCVEDDCPRGSLGCECYGNESCDAYEGTPMTCREGECTITQLPEPGVLGGPCDETIACEEHEGTLLECRSGVCQVPGCPIGSVGCACGPYDRCQSALSCREGVCYVADCAAGSLGCECAAGVCDEGVCNGAVCQPDGATVRVTGAGVYGCEMVVLGARRSGIEVVDFQEGIIGEAYGRSGRLALAWVGPEDRPHDGSVALLPSYDDGATPLRIESARCFGRFGEALPDAVVSVE